MRVGTQLGMHSNIHPFSFKNFSGLQAWYRADLGTTVATGVSVWSDQSGSGDGYRDAKQPTGALQPVLNASDGYFNNQKTITFSGSQLLQTGIWSSSLPQPCTYVVVGKAVTGKYLIDSIVGATQLAMYDSAGILQIYAGSNKATGLSDTSSSVFITQWNGASTYVNVSQNTPQLIGNAGADAATGITIGCYAGGGAFSGSTIAEVAVFNRTLTNNEIAQINNYASLRYNISIGA
jgi:hypothetical protein